MDRLWLGTRTDCVFVSPSRSEGDRTSRSRTGGTLGVRMVSESRPDGHASWRPSLTKVARVDLLLASQATTIITCTCNDPFDLEPTTS